jgi:hypothetical protein
MNIENDPRLTAYALGELVESERLIFEQDLANAGGAAVVLGEIRDFAAHIREAFAGEPVYAMRDDQRALLLAEAEAVAVVPLAEGVDIEHSDRILPWVTQPVISEVDKRKIAEALKPSPWRRLAPLLGSLGVAAGVIWLAGIVLMQEPGKSGESSGRPGEVAGADEDLPPITIEQIDFDKGDEWIRRRFAEARSGGGYPYRYGAPIAASQIQPRKDDLFDPSIEGQRVSEFPVNIGRQSYENLRVLMLAGVLPPAGRISVGQVLNAFEYGYPSPQEGETFSVETELADCPWDSNRQLLQIGVTAAETDGEVVAEEVQMAVEFNPEKIAGYRLIGERPATEIASSSASESADVSGGQSVTALYEVIPQEESPGVDGEMMTIRVDYKEDGELEAKSQETRVAESAKTPWREASDDLRFAASVAGYGMLLGGEKGKSTATYDLVLELARDAIGEDPEGKRKEFVEWIEKTIALKKDKVAGE